MHLEIDEGEIKKVFQTNGSKRTPLVKEFLSKYSELESLILEELKYKPFVDFKDISLKIKTLVEHKDSVQLYLFINLLLEGMIINKKVTVLEFSSKNFSVIIIPYKGSISMVKPESSNKKVIYMK